MSLIFLLFLKNAPPPPPLLILEDWYLEVIFGICCYTFFPDVTRRSQTNLNDIESSNKSYGFEKRLNWWWVYPVSWTGFYLLKAAKAALACPQLSTGQKYYLHLKENNQLPFLVFTLISPLWRLRSVQSCFQLTWPFLTWFHLQLKRRDQLQFSFL